MVNTLSQASALNPGSELWLTADLSHSQWTAKLDWHVNFQIIKSSRHETQKLSPYLTETLAETGLSTYSPGNTGEAPLLIHSGNLLPNKWLVVVPFTGDLGLWLNKARGIWEQLQKPTVRLFLPTGQNSSSVEAETFSENVDLTVVLDLTN